MSARSGIILGPGGGFIEKVEPIFRHGFGGRLGSGRQWMSWIALDDAVEILIRLATDDAFSGPVNLTSPNPVRNREFTKILADVIGRPALFRVPRTAMVLATGRRVTNEFLLQSARVMPSRLLAAGTAFRHPTAHDAIRASMVGR